MSMLTRALFALAFLSCALSLNAQENEGVIPITTGIVPDEVIQPEKEPEKPKFPTFKLTGFFHLDGARFSQDDLNRATVGDIQDGLAFRRARIAVTGKVSETVKYIMELDFSNTQPLFVDMWLDFAEIPILGNVRIGRWRQPFGMTELTSIRNLPFLERPLPFALSPFRQTGIGFYNHAKNERATWALSAYRHLSDFFGNVVGDNGGYGLAGRATFLPIDRGENRVLHVGGGYTYNDPAMDQLLFFSPPEVFIAQSLGGFNAAPFVGTPFFVDTGFFAAHHYHAFNFEAASGHGPFLLQSELRFATVKPVGQAAVTFPAFYAHARYMLTGETIPYNRKRGVFSGVIPNQKAGCCGGIGAWEIAARYSFIDLNGLCGCTGPGRELHSMTLGLSWYVNQYVKFQMNYIRAHLNDWMLGRSNADIFAFRTQLSY